MSDLIDRQEAIEAIVKESHKDGAYGYVDASDATKVLNTLPSAERKGHWVKKWHTVFKEELPCCSECNNFMAFRWGYCPNCGARMELE